MQNIEKLLTIMRALRDPDSGCPWDLEQDFKSIVAWTLEEAYEVQEAINTGDHRALCHELGDLLFQVVYHAQMASEAGAFDFSDVVDSINDKLVRRHPHVFGDEVVSDARDQSRSWQRIKHSEQDETDDDTGPGLLANISLHQPAMRRAEKLQLRAAAVGFDWPDHAPVLDKIREELGELEEAVAGETAGSDKVIDECGDLLFVMINLIRKLSVNPELALARANNKFVRRFSYIEQQLNEEGTALEDAGLERMDALWNAAKQRESATDNGQGL
ncbi:MAG: nucleoside triphosphate pyrophosphohydrolase [Thiotrichales bacterium]|nr:nucleoside triphosphate pyrophosphohydrolase [Thiotrichales bacterium]